MASIFVRRAAHGAALASRRLGSVHRAALIPRMSAITSPSFSRSQPRPLIVPSMSSRGYATKMIQFYLADIGEGISEVEVLQWYIQEGATVEQFTPLCEVQSDKATVPISSRYHGVVKKLRYKPGDMAKVGSALCDIEVDESVVAAPSGHGSHDAPAPAASTPPPPPPPVAAAPPPPPPPPPAPKAVVHEEVTQEISTSKGKRIVLAAPAVRFLAKQNSVDLSKVKGSGKDGRVSKGDLLQFLAQPPAAPAPAAAPAAAPRAAPGGVPEVLHKPRTVAVPQDLAADQVVPLRGFARVMVTTMTQSLTIPHLGLSDEIDMTRLVQARDILKPLAAARGVKLTYMPFFIKAASLAMKSYPIINSKLNPNGTEVTLIAAHNIAIAVDTPAGLVVPNVKNCERKSVIEIAQEMQRVVLLAMQNKLAPEDLQGSTFSLSNVGAIGGTYASPVLVAPQVVIGAMGRIQKLPRYDNNGNVVPVQLMNISWSADHRVIDGGSITNFSNLWKQYVEEPSSMTFDMR